MAFFVFCRVECFGTVLFIGGFIFVRLWAGADVDCLRLVSGER